MKKWEYCTASVELYKDKVHLFVVRDIVSGDVKMEGFSLVELLAKLRRQGWEMVPKKSIKPGDKILALLDPSDTDSYIFKRPIER